ncbi:MAG: hypothetical protein GEU88_15365 [Solirubrobacterales bacterium]|nr:hypothetical protein [Solirubrobacterales bacterium]
MSSSRFSLLVVAALIAVGGVIYASADVDVGGDADTPPRARSAESVQAGAEDPAVALARRYALAARDWTARTYERSRARQRRLAGGGYREALARTPTPPGYVARLRKQRARSVARVVATTREPSARRGVARVLVQLREQTKTRQQALERTVVYEVLVRPIDGQRRVVGWTILPGIDGL